MGGKKKLIDDNDRRYEIDAGGYHLGGHYFWKTNTPDLTNNNN